MHLASPKRWSGISEGGGREGERNGNDDSDVDNDRGGDRDSNSNSNSNSDSDSDMTMKRKVCTVFHAPSNDSSGSAPLTNRLIKYQSHMPAKPRMGMAKYTASWL